jgi:WS/DGAT/MGAT family acyltransferase
VAKSALSGVLPAWEEVEDIKIDDHVRYHRLPPPGGERELGVLVSALHSAPMDRTRPLWELHVIDGLHDRRFAFLYRGHHAVMDGATAMKLLMPASHTPRERGTPPFFAVPAGAPAASPGFDNLRNLLRLLAVGFRTAATLSGAARQTFSALRSAPGPLIPRADAPISIINNPVSSKRRVATQDFELERFKRLGAAIGGTVNDVYLAVCAGALRRFLLEFDALPTKSLVATIPVALKRTGNEAIGNRLSAIVVPLATNLADPRMRVTAILAEVQKAKALQQSLPEQFTQLLLFVGMAPIIVDKLRGVRFKDKLMFNLAISNVPGPRTKLYFNGAEMLAMYPISVIMAGPALNMTLLGYSKGLHLGIVCSDAVPHVQRLAVHAAAAFRELEVAYGLQRKPRAARRKASRPASHK